MAVTHHAAPSFVAVDDIDVLRGQALPAHQPVPASSIRLGACLDAHGGTDQGTLILGGTGSGSVQRQHDFASICVQF